MLRLLYHSIYLLLSIKIVLQAVTQKTTYSEEEEDARQKNMKNNHSSF
ncbi:hypothetical protein J5U23_02422 [Saccharolobus shibatae B12]|uniref:Uncharacterized protein n=1 Tax=Saccharolobus shibatae (strain ATCC 51178 / DSM 5389 / JCM 8931 / NBRC 15437 / B12) TaxID=523848 RepID=A0A8F5BQE3_SACSH|nr:hypothetical protein J5U23_02422 [Saccharolobus shibatae B12]